ncbi:MAG: flagellar biosynthetic protein FliO [Lachnospiraceae bacterium]|nr:flagellar biosynthetic protein FliO [Candidatus Colinaster scatohippi]
MLISIADKADSVVQFITVLLIFAVVLIVTFLVTKWLGNYQKQQGNGANIEIIDSARISPNTFVEIIHIGSKYVAVAVSKENVSLLCELSEDEIVVKQDNTVKIADFKSILAKAGMGMPEGGKQHKDSDRNDE